MEKLRASILHALQAQTTQTLVYGLFQKSTNVVRTLIGAERVAAILCDLPYDPEMQPSHIEKDPVG